MRTWSASNSPLIAVQSSAENTFGESILAILSLLVYLPSSVFSEHLLMSMYCRNLVVFWPLNYATESVRNLFEICSICCHLLSSYSLTFALVRQLRNQHFFFFFLAAKFVTSSWATNLRISSWRDLWSVSASDLIVIALFAHLNCTNKREISPPK